jgi:hypothetical protein
MPKAKSKPRYETWETEYEGENGPPWVAFLTDHEAKGWQLVMAKVTVKISETRFRGRVRFRRPLAP